MQPRNEGRRSEDRQRAQRSESAAGHSSHPFSVPLNVKRTVRILVVEDDRALREGLTSTLQVEGFDVTAASTGAEAVDLLRRSPHDIVLTDLYLTPVSGLEVLRAALRSKRDAVVIFMTGNPTVETSIETLSAGAWDYLPKPFSAMHLQVLLGRATHVILQARQMRELRAQLQSDATVIGSSAIFREAIARAERVAPTDAAVLLVGESGTGKELIARFIHQRSRRATRPFVAAACSALPEQAMESELFGHRRGAFPGADRDKTGLLESANDGTMFLDDVTCMPAALQAKLLRVLQDGVVRRAGSERSDAVVDVRFIAATSVDPQNAVQGGAFRADLLYRLSVVPIRIPPLRERREDIPLLANHMLVHYWQRHRRPGTQPPRLTTESIEYLRTRSWPGNVRELQNVIEHAVVLADAAQPITPTDLPMGEDVDPVASISRALTPDVLSEAFHPARAKLLAEFERVYLRKLVSRAGGNMAKAARLAHIDRTTLYRLVGKHGLSGGWDATLHPET
ncbi:MAG TPA: sigma-54 dependent transcriptional regulator [Gemmatimonadaceae bacterium]|nr:sigma-54 dependent transcriptional regulator [Gemmatimonadaceae bacterium]